MKICMLITNSLVKDPRVQREALFAHNHGYEVFVVGVWDENYSEKFYKQLPYKVVICPIDTKYRKKLYSLVGKIKRFIIPIIELKKECLSIDPNIIHANDFDTLPAAFLAAKKLKRCHVHYDSHEIYTGNPVLLKHPFIRKIILLCERYIVKRINSVSSVSNAAAEQLSELLRIKRPTVVTNCSYYVPKESLPPKNESFEVVYQGRITPYRGYEEFVLSAINLPKSISLIVRGYGETKVVLERLVSEFGIKNVVFPNPVSIAELIPSAAVSSVGVVLTKPVSDNYKYTVSNKVFECIQARLPVILSDVPEHRYLVDSFHIGIIIDEVTPKCIMEAILRFYNDREFYEYCLANVETAASLLCWENEGLKLISCYNA